MPPKAPEAQSLRESPRSRKSRAEPTSASLKTDAVENEALNQSTPKRKTSPKAASTAVVGALDTKATTNGTSQPQVSAKEGKVEEIEQKFGNTKRKRVLLEEGEKRITGETPKKVKRTKKIKEEDLENTSDEETLQMPKRKPEISVKQEAKEEIETPEDAATPKNRTKKTKTKVGEETAEGVEKEEDAETPKKTRRKRKTKEEREAEAMPIAARTTGLGMFIGAHVSCAKGSLGHGMYIASMKLKRVLCRRAKLRHQLLAYRVTVPSKPRAGTKC